MKTEEIEALVGKLDELAKWQTKLRGEVWHNHHVEDTCAEAVSALRFLLEERKNLVHATSEGRLAPNGQLHAADAIGDIRAERERQKTVEGWTDARDDRQYKGGQLARAAGAYAYHAALSDRGREAVGETPPREWPWGYDWWKPKDRRRDLVRAGALIVAEIERLDRASPPESQGDRSELPSDERQRETKTGENP